MPLSRIEGGASKRARGGCPFKVRANGLLSGTRFPRFVGWGEATALARGVNRAMTRGSLSDAPCRADRLATSAVLDY